MDDLDLIRQIAAVLFVFGLLGAAAVLLAKRRGTGLLLPGRTRRTGCLEVVDRLRLTPQHSIHLIRAGKRMLLVSADTAGCHLLESGPANHFDPSEPNS